MIGALALVMVAFYGALLSISVFLKPLLEEFGCTRAMVSGAMSTATGIAGLFSIVTGRLTDKYGARLLIGLGAFLGGLGYLLMSQVSSLWQLYLYFGVIVGMSMTSCWVPINATVCQRFVEKRVLALGITTSGVNIGQMLLPPLVAYFITGHGWRPGYFILAIVVWIAVIPAMMLLGGKPPQSTGELDSRKSKTDKLEDKVAVQPREGGITEAAKTVPFWMLTVTSFVTAAGFYFIAVHIVAHATDVGIAATLAALVMTFMGGGNIIGKLLVQPIATRIGSRFTILLLFALQALCLFLLMGTTSLLMFLILGAAFGFGSGGTTPIRTSMIVEFFGSRSVGTMMGVIEIAWAIGTILGPILAGYVFDLTRSYDKAFLAGGFLMATGVVATFFLKAPRQSRTSYSQPAKC